MLSNEAGSILGLLKWIAKKNEVDFAVIGYPALKRNLLRITNIEYEDEEITDFLHELSQADEVRIEDLTFHKKYWLTNPLFSSAIRFIEKKLKESELRGRKYLLKRDKINHDSCLLLISVGYEIDCKLLIIGSFPYILTSEQAIILGNIYESEEDEKQREIDVFEIIAHLKNLEYPLMISMQRNWEQFQFTLEAEGKHKDLEKGENYNLYS